jgi:hypothetical protein
VAKNSSKPVTAAAPAVVVPEPKTLPPDVELVNQAIRSAVATGIPTQVIADRVLRALPDITGLQSFGERLHCRVRKGQAGALEPHLSGALSAAGIVVTTMRVVPASLEDVFIDRVATGPASTEVSV